jgi:hypothetical protein
LLEIASSTHIFSSQETSIASAENSTRIFIIAYKRFLLLLTSSLFSHTPFQSLVLSNDTSRLAFDVIFHTKIVYCKPFNLYGTLHRHFNILSVLAVKQNAAPSFVTYQIIYVHATCLGSTVRFYGNLKGRNGKERSQVIIVAYISNTILYRNDCCYLVHILYY